MKTKKEITSKIYIRGSEKDGYVLTVEDEVSNQDMAITKPEMIEIYELLKKKLKK